MTDQVPRIEAHIDPVAKRLMEINSLDNLFTTEPKQALWFHSKDEPKKLAETAEKKDNTLNP